jgi:hypothetical protein
MLMIVIEKPMQVTMVSAVPFVSAGAFWATSVEKSGESAITTNPQKTRNPINRYSDSVANRNGEIRQQPQDKHSAINATRLVPITCARYPPNTQDNPPSAIIENDNNGILKDDSGFSSLYV